MTTIAARISILQATDADERAEYERVFFRAFEKATHNKLVRRIWTYDDEARRLATRIPYDEQVVFVVRDRDGQIIAGVAVNIAMRSLQASAFGFRLPAGAGRGAEVLTFFSTTPLNKAEMNELWRALGDNLRARGFQTLFATCADLPLRAYLHCGCERLAQTEIAGEQRHFLQMDLRLSNGNITTRSRAA